MTSRICKYGCGVLLEGFDEQARKYIEAGSGGLHTKERCEETKAKLAQKNDHGNEDTGPRLLEEPPKFVDHSAKGTSKVKIFLSAAAMAVEQEYNNFLAANNGKIKTQGAQFHPTNEGFAIALYYEEVKQ